MHYKVKALVWPFLLTKPERCRWVSETEQILFFGTRTEALNALTVAKCYWDSTTPKPHLV